MAVAISTLEKGQVHAVRMAQAGDLLLGIDVDKGQVTVIFSGGALDDIGVYFPLSPEKAREFVLAEVLKGADKAEAAVNQPEKGNA